MKEADVIAAIASPIGTGAISTIRVSGAESWEIVNSVLNKKIESPIPRKVYKRLIIDDKGAVDEALLVFYKCPKSYTGENMVEIFCHGGYIVTHMVLRTILNAGARQAEPGEFTKRAFLNDKLDLSKAEAIRELIEARAENEARAFLKSLLGGIKNFVESIRQELMEIIAEIEVELDYPDEFDIDKESIERKLIMVKNEMEEIVRKAEYSVKASQGIRLVIVGKPNVGKSTLFNRLLKEDRAIVTSIPGTTRDVISEDINIMGQHYKLLDTAGLRSSEDHIEKIGVERTKKEIDKGDIILFVIDPTQGIDKLDKRIYNLVKGKPHIVVINKVDISDVPQEMLNAFSGEKITKISAMTGEGLANLEKTINDLAKVYVESLSGDVILTTQRQKELLEASLYYIGETIKGLHKGFPSDIISIDIRKAIEKLDTLTGRNFTDDLLDVIFSHFCVGK